MTVNRNKEIKILTVCGMGLGSGLVLRINIEKVLKDLGVKASVEVSDVVSAKSQVATLIVTSSEFEQSLKGTNIKIITIKNYVDLNEIKMKLSEAIKELNEKEGDKQ